MGAYILRRLLLVIPTLLGIMIVNFTLVQFVPGGPIEQIIAQMEGGGDVFEGIAGGGSDIEQQTGGANDRYVGARGLPPSSSKNWSGNSALTNLLSSGSST